MTKHIGALIERAEGEVPDLIGHLYDATWYLEDANPDNHAEAAWSLFAFTEKVASHDLRLQPVLSEYTLLARGHFFHLVMTRRRYVDTVRDARAAQANP